MSQRVETSARELVLTRTRKRPFTEEMVFQRHKFWSLVVVVSFVDCKITYQQPEVNDDRVYMYMYTTQIVYHFDSRRRKLIFLLFPYISAKSVVKKTIKPNTLKARCCTHQ